MLQITNNSPPEYNPPKGNNKTKIDMKNNLLFIIGSALIAAGNVLASEMEADTSPEAAAAPNGDEPKRRGRPPGSTNAPKEPVTAPTTAPAGDDPVARFQSNLLVIKPLVENQQGEDVKKVIAKYSKTGLKDLPATAQADFEKDIAALSY